MIEDTKAVYPLKPFADINRQTFLTLEMMKGPANFTHDMLIP